MLLIKYVQTNINYKLDFLLDYKLIKDVLVKCVSYFLKLCKSCVDIIIRKSVSKCTAKQCSVQRVIVM